MNEQEILSLANYVWRTETEPVSVKRTACDSLEHEIAAAIRRAVESERYACAKLAEACASRNEDCPAGCKCGDGYHIAAAIRKRGEA